MRLYVSPVSPASTVHIKPRVVGDATKEHPYRLARVSRGVEFYRGAAAMEESGLSSLGEAVCDHQVGENGLSERFETEISPMHRSTSTVG